MSSRFDRTPEKTQRAQRLRAEMTDAERRLWRALRGKRLEQLKFRRQHPVGPYILDFYCPEIRLCVEVDGGQHNEAAVIRQDERRTEALERTGITVIRFWNNDVFGNIEGVLDAILEHVSNLRREQELARGGIPSPWKGEG